MPNRPGSSFTNPPAFFSEYGISDIKTGRPYTDQLMIKVLDLTNTELADDSPKEQKLLKWAKVFKAKSLSELEKLCEGEEVLEELKATIKKLSAEEKYRLSCEAHERYERDLRSEYVGGYREAEEKWRPRAEEAEARADAAEDLVRKLQQKIAELEK